MIEIIGNIKLFTYNDYIKIKKGVADRVIKRGKKMKRLKESGLTLTKLEVKVLEEILSQGSFYEEAGGNDIVAELHDTSIFIGWEIYEEEVKGCRGAIASLVKKGVIGVNYDRCMEMSSYCTYYALDFLDEKEHGFHKLDLGNCIIK